MINVSAPIDRLAPYRDEIESALSSALSEFSEPNCLYDPVHYLFEAGGKRVRPVLTMLACEAVGGNPDHAVHAAIAVELLHNFTLVHDDIMDSSAKRRGRDTVHVKWNTSTAILADDVAKSFGWTTEIFFGVFSVALVAGGLVAPRMGRALDRYGAARVMAWGSAASAIAMAMARVLWGSMREFTGSRLRNLTRKPPATRDCFTASPVSRMVVSDSKAGEELASSR